ncbi:MAG: hypothetical protein ABGW90_12345, partial [Martelella sp.]
RLSQTRGAIGASDRSTGVLRTLARTGSPKRRYAAEARVKLVRLHAGAGRFAEARRLLASLGCKGTICWCFEALDQAGIFFTALGGKPFAFAEEEHGGKVLGKVSYIWD